MRNVLLVVSVVALAAGSSACATKKFVGQRVGEVNDKVETLSQSLEETQERTRRNESRISEVDQKADAAGRSAEQANAAAADARTAATAAGERAEAVERENRRLIFEVVLSEDQGNFAFGKAELPDSAKAELDRLVDELKQTPRTYFIEIEGHTDSLGAEAYNHRLGLERAESVKRYLYEQHNLPLHKMNVISYGEEKPVAPNKTRQDRAMNRRVVVKVLA
jgi:outer membrane protein OmpA-like peptidoglycan-associated protein